MLDIDYPDDFLLFGIVSSEKNYRLAWLLNTLTEHDFERKDDIDYFVNHEPAAAFARFDYYDELNRLSYHLVENKDDAYFLLPELKNIDYLMMVKGAIEYFESEAYVKLLSSIAEIQFVTSIDISQLKSKNNLIIPEFNTFD